MQSKRKIIGVWDIIKIIKWKPTRNVVALLYTKRKPQIYTNFDTVLRGWCRLPNPQSCCCSRESQTASPPRLLLQAGITEFGLPQPKCAQLNWKTVWTEGFVSHRAMLYVDTGGLGWQAGAAMTLSLLFAFQHDDGSLVLAAAHKSSVAEAVLKLIAKGTRLDCGC